MARNAYERFGAHLKDLRTRRLLTLRQVSELSDQVAVDQVGRFSHAYLSQLESGKRTALALEKVLSLAAIYVQPPQKIIEQAPAALRDKLVVQLGKYLAAGGELPHPLRELPWVRREVSLLMESILRSQARNVTAPLGWEKDGLATILDVVSLVTATPFLASHEDHEALVDDFRDYYSGDLWLVLNRIAHQPQHASREWKLLATDFRDWLAYERKYGELLIRMLDYWSIDFVSHRDADCPLTCEFPDGNVNADYGFRCVPIGAVRPVAWRLLARWLYQNGITEERRNVSPPNMREAAIDIVANLIDPTSPGPAFEVATRADYVADALAVLVNDVAYFSRKPQPAVARRMWAVREFLDLHTPLADDRAG